MPCLAVVGALFVLLALAGCADLKLPSRTEPWCLPKAKYEREAKRLVVGARCAW